MVVPIKPFEMPRTQSEIIEFKVRNMDAPKQVWQPTFENQQPVRDQYGNGEPQQSDFQHYHN